MSELSVSSNDVSRLADASNELCVAIELLKIVKPEMRDFAEKNLYQRKDDVWQMLKKFGF